MDGLPGEYDNKTGECFYRSPDTLNGNNSTIKKTKKNCKAIEIDKKCAVKWTTNIQMNSLDGNCILRYDNNGVISYSPLNCNNCTALNLNIILK